VAFGAGSVTGNFRLDEGEISSVVGEAKIGSQRNKLGAIIGDDVRAGIHTSFAPGVKVGSGSFINSAVFVSRDVKEERYVTVKDGVLEMRENRSEVPAVRE
jgi:bifunctional UDP-N-acetylglucosamine pyrophosphorylase/glucosamine-1-phosphate N-acetyltransferase